MKLMLLGCMQCAAKGFRRPCYAVFGGVPVYISTSQHDSLLCGWLLPIQLAGMVQLSRHVLLDNMDIAVIIVVC